MYVKTTAINKLELLAVSNFVGLLFRVLRNISLSEFGFVRQKI